MRHNGPGHRTTVVIGALSAAYLLVFVSWIAFRWGPAGDRAVIGDAAFLPVSLVAAALSWRAAKIPRDKRQRQAWRLFAGAYLSYWAGDLCWFYFDAVRGTRPFPSIADAFYISFYPLLVAGLIRFPRRRRNRAQRLTLSLDTAIVTLGALLVVWYLVIDPTVAADRGAAWLPRVLDVLYPVGDAAVLFALAVVLLSGDRTRDPALIVLAVGLAIFVLADVIYARQSLDGSYTDASWVNALWMLGQLITVVSSQLVRSTDPPPSPTIGDGSAVGAQIRVPRLPYMAIVGALALLVTVSVRNLSTEFVELVLGAVALTGLVVARQVTVLQDNRALMSELRRVAETDGLTGLATRRHFFVLAEQVVRKAQLTETGLGVLMIDIDHFKTINDTMGHAGGDTVLAEVARRCGEALRSSDILGRYGGDELVALLPGANAEAVWRAAARLNKTVARGPIAYGTRTCIVTLSIGATHARPPATIEALLSDADAALYQAKQAGRDRWELHRVP